ncbi:hypothetical protein ACN9MZ_06215 [Pseudoduganella sp. S-14]|jgi:hypothetical protein|uniref:hypothetical protein n=1 Tax=Pseudoduganella sp. S-14 TaxID=3404065 RepID=UPI003CF51CE2
MSRISAPILARAIKAIQAMNTAQKEALADELFQAQPTLLGAVLILPRMGVPMERVEFALNLLFVCFQSMKETGWSWPRISEDELDRQATRYSAIIQFSEGMHPMLVQQAQQQFATGHPEPALLAYVSTETTRWLSSVAPLESDKYVLLSAMNVVNCIAYVPMPKRGK